MFQSDVVTRMRLNSHATKDSSANIEHMQGPMFEIKQLMLFPAFEPQTPTQQPIVLAKKRPQGSAAWSAKKRFPKTL